MLRYNFSYVKKARELRINYCENMLIRIDLTGASDIH